MSSTVAYLPGRVSPKAPQFLPSAFLLVAILLPVAALAVPGDRNFVQLGGPGHINLGIIEIPGIHGLLKKMAQPFLVAAVRMVEVLGDGLHHRFDILVEETVLPGVDGALDQFLVGDHPARIGRHDPRSSHSQWLVGAGEGENGQMADSTTDTAPARHQPDRPWMMRTYSGHSTAKASNELYRTNLAKGQTGLSVAFDLPTQTGYDPDEGPGFGWPLSDLPWVNPSPNASSLNMARCFPGTVLFEGTTLSEGRGTTASLEVVGAPDVDMERVLGLMRQLAPGWLRGCLIRPCAIEPTFHKHAGKLCSALQIHTDTHLYRHDEFQPYRIAALILRSIRTLHPDYQIWRVFPYEYETERLAIDLLSGGTFLREWVDNPSSTPADLDARLKPDEERWLDERAAFLMY